jgi:hypothetical protein
MSVSVVQRFIILEDRQKSLETTIKFLLDEKRYSWEKIYLFSAFVSHPGVEQVKKILRHPSLNENTEVVIAIGKKDHFNNPSDIQDLLNFIDPESTNIKTKPVSFICPINNFHIKAYCFLGRRVKDDKEIGFSIIGSSNLTWHGLECEGELCISIHNLNLTKNFIYRLSNKYSKSPRWKQEIENDLSVQQNSTPVNQAQAPITSTPRNGKFIKLGVITDIALIDKATNLANDKENIDCFHSSPTTLEQAKEDFPERSLCLLLTKNKIFKIVEIMSYEDDKQQTEGCFVRYRENVIYELSDDIREIIADEKYKIISDEKDMDELEYKTLKDFEEEVNEYQKMLEDNNYKKGLKKGLEKGKNQMQSEIERKSKIDDISLIKKELELLRQSI